MARVVVRVWYAVVRYNRIIVIKLNGDSSINGKDHGDGKGGGKGMVCCCTV